MTKIKTRTDASSVIPSYEEPEEIISKSSEASNCGNDFIHKQIGKLDFICLIDSRFLLQTGKRFPSAAGWIQVIWKVRKKIHNISR